MGAPAGPYALVLNQTIQITPPSGAGGNQAWKWVALYNFTPFLLTVQYGTDIGYLQPFMADVFPLPDTGAPLVVTPGSIGLAGQSTTLSAVFYDQDDGDPTGFPIPLTAPPTSLATLVDISDGQYGGNPIPQAPTSLVNLSYTSFNSFVTAVSGAGGHSIWVFSFSFRVNTLSSSTGYLFGSMELSDGTSSYATCDSPMGASNQGTGISWGFTSKLGRPIKIAQGNGIGPFITQAFNLSSALFMAEYAVTPF